MARRLLVFLLLSLAFTVPAAAQTREVTDQIDRRVTVPREVKRVVALQHQSLDIIIELGAADRLVGVLRSWRSMIPGIERLSPGLEALPTPGDLANVNIEDLLRLQPDVVSVTNYAPPDMIRQIERVGIPVIVISLSQGERGARRTLRGLRRPAPPTAISPPPRWNG